MTNASYISLAVALGLTLCVIMQGTSPALDAPANPAGPSSHREEPSDKAEVPDVSTLSVPQGRLGEVIRLGRSLVQDTASHELTKPYVGNSLSCTSCHLENGTHPTAGTFIGVATAYPAWSPRENRVITLEDRILNCFMRSCNGLRPPLGSEPSVAIATYITWLSSGQSMQMNGAKPLGPYGVIPLALNPAQGDASRGEALYRDQCASCHGDDGQGDAESPPVWGDKSYNHGAGLANDLKLASWLIVAMPLDEANLSATQALDLAVYINTHHRPPFILKDHLPPPAEMGQYNAQTEGQ